MRNNRSKSKYSGFESRVGQASTSENRFDKYLSGKRPSVDSVFGSVLVVGAPVSVELEELVFADQGSAAQA